MYDAFNLTMLDGSPFESKTQASFKLGISRDVINYFLDTNKPEGIKGTYLFSRELNNEEIKGLKEKSEFIVLGNKKKSLSIWC